MQKGITILKSAEKDLMGIMTLLRSTNHNAVPVSEIKKAIIEGKSVVAKNESGEIVGHNIIFETKEGEILDSVCAVKPGYQVSFREMAEELMKIKRGDHYVDIGMPCPGSCDK